MTADQWKSLNAGTVPTDSN